MAFARHSTFNSCSRSSSMCCIRGQGSAMTVAANVCCSSLFVVVAVFFFFFCNTYYVWHAAKCLASNVASLVVRAYARLPGLNLAGLNLFAFPHLHPFCRSCPALFLRTAFLIFKCNNFLACNFIFGYFAMRARAALV